MRKQIVSFLGGNKFQLDATEVFIEDLIVCSTCFGHHYAHHQELKCIIQWLLSVVFGAVVFKLLIWCGAESCVSGLQGAAASCKPDTQRQCTVKIKSNLYLSSFISANWKNTSKYNSFFQIATGHITTMHG